LYGKASTLTKVVVALLAVFGVVVGAVAFSRADNKPHAASSATATTVPRTVGSEGSTTTEPQLVLPAISIPPATTSTTAPTPTTTAAAVAAATATTTTAPPGPCGAGDLAVTTSTDKANYGAGAPVTITTVLRDVVACRYQPAASSPGACPTTIAVLDGQGRTVWPAPGAVACAQPRSGVLQPGTMISVTATWNEQAAGGTYRAVGTWTWSGPGAAAAQAQGAAGFTIA
jgi:hypothetical protein